jgi:ATP-dependent helicase HepA
MDAQLVPGIVVSFNGEGEYEILSLGQNGRSVTIQAEGGEPLTVSAASAALVRVTRQPGDPVRSLISGQLGVVQSLVGSHDGTALYRVVFADGRTSTVGEGQLRGVPITDPVQLLARGRVDRLRDFQLRTMAARLSLAHQYDELTTLSHTRLELKPHQIFVAHRVIETPPHRYLLADEVGLGKTIEAGLVLKELRARGVARRVLVIAPANLTRQWQWELRNKFNEAFALYTAETIAVLREQRPGENVWTVKDSVICSAQYITAGERAERQGPRATYAQQENLPQRMQEILLADWDLVIVDEAHHARRSSRTANKQETNILYWFLSHLAQRTLSLLLLTATPMQLDTSELYWLLDLLDPALYPSHEDFEAARKQIAALNSLIGEIRRWDGPDGAGRDPARRAAVIADIVRRLQAQDAGEWDEELVEASLQSPPARQSLLDLLARGHRLSEVIIRNRKSEVGGFMPRRPKVIPVPLSAEEQDAYDAVGAYVREGYRQSQSINNQALGFLMVTFQKLVSSSSYALDRSLQRRRERLAAGLLRPEAEIVDEDVLDGADLDDEAIDRCVEAALAAPAAQGIAAEIAILDDLRARLALISEDTKLQRLRELLRGLPPTEQDGRAVPTKVLIFSQFRETVEYLARELGDELVCAVFHGSLSPDGKDEAARRFRDPDGAQVLISTEAGGEGRNFQFCHVMVNYDLPWNPMRVEQRIGRLDRIGQRHQILIHNFALKGTVEERVVEVLNQRIHLFEQTVGGIEPILGDVARDVRELIMSQDAKGVERFAARLERSVHAARELERQQADFVMDMRSFAPQQAEAVIARSTRLDYEDLRAWARRALEAAGCKLDKRRDRENTYEVFAREEFKRRFRHLESLPRLVTFNRERALADEDLDFLAFGHPIIDTIVQAWLGDEFGGLATSWTLREASLPAFDGYLFNFIADLSGARHIRRLYPIAVARGGDVVAELGDELVALCAKYAKWTDFPPDPPPCPEIDDCYAAAQAHLSRLLREECDRLAERAAQAHDQEVAKLGRYYSYRRTIAAQKVDATATTLASLRARGEEARGVLPMWEAKLEQSRTYLADLDEQERRAREGLRGRRNVGFQYDLLNAAMVRNAPP